MTADLPIAPKFEVRGGTRPRDIVEQRKKGQAAVVVDRWTVLEEQRSVGHERVLATTDRPSTAAFLHLFSLHLFTTIGASDLSTMDGG